MLRPSLSYEEIFNTPPITPFYPVEHINFSAESTSGRNMLRPYAELLIPY